MKNKTSISSVIIGLIVVVASIVGYVMFKKPAAPNVDTTPVVVTPAVTGDTANFVSFSVAPGAMVGGTVVATGTLKGGYFFEANMRVHVLDAAKNTLKETNGTATTDWMTAGPVSFTTSLNFTGITPGNGYIRLMNDNPSGDPVNDKYIDIPVVFQ